jgi:hypothetical protein
VEPYAKRQIVGMLVQAPLDNGNEFGSGIGYESKRGGNDRLGPVGRLP